MNEGESIKSILIRLLLFVSTRDSGINEIPKPDSTRVEAISKEEQNWKSFSKIHTTKIYRKL